jgi:6-phosphofructokinase 1
VTILGHIQRGGSPSVADRLLASRMGSAAVQAFIDGQSNVMIGIQGNNIVSVDLNRALQKKKELDLSLYDLANTLS